MRETFALCLAVALLAVGFAEAQSVVVPNANINTAGTSGTNSLLRNSGNPRTYQFGIAAAELSAIPKGAEIVGLSFRVYSGTTAAWPTAPVTWTNYDITLAEAALPIATFSTTLAANMKNPVPVRTGPMTIPAGTFQVTTSNPNPFDTFYFAFQKPYAYQGGDLVILVTHPGSNSTTNAFMDIVTSNPATFGTAMYAASYQAATGSVYTSFIIPRIHYGYGPAKCVGANGSLNLILSNSLVAPTPAPGAINLAVTNGQPGAIGGILVSALRAKSPIPLPGCNLLIFPAFLGNIPISLNAGGRYDLNLKFPAVKVSIEVQAYATDTTTKAGFVASNAISFQVG